MTLSPDQIAAANQTATTSSPTTQVVTKQEAQNIATTPTANVEKYAGGPGGGRGGQGGPNLQQAEELNRNIANGITKVGGNKTKTYAPSTNPLDEYASYTYGLTLHVLTREDYNTLVSTPNNFKPTKTLISSAGRYRGTRDPEFSDDFYFDNLKFDTVIGVNANTRGTNVITLEFTIIEPYGMTLLDRIMNVNNNGLNGKNYLDMPYLLEINFFGEDRSGSTKKITDQTKWIPMKLTGFKIKASVKGSEYNITAVPFNHSANLETLQSIKTRMHITASTVGEYFSSGDIAQSTASADSYRNNADAYAYQSGQNGAGGGRSTPGYRDPRIVGSTDAPGVTSVSAATAPTSFNTTSFTTAWNGWMASENKKGNLGQPDQIAFVFNESADGEISNSPIVDAKKNSVRRVGSTDTQTTAKANEGKDATTTDFSSIVHDLEPGTKVNDVINLVLSQSKYFLDQVVDSSLSNKDPKAQSADSTTVQQQAKPLKVWKIVPSIELLDFDSERNQWAKKITFYVSVYTVFQQRDDRLPKSPPPNPVKRYDYFYTGKNSSVINFDIDYNALYFTAKNADRGATTTGAGASQKPEDRINNSKADSNANKNQIQPEIVHVTSGDQNAGAGGGAQRSETQNARSALQSIYTSAGGDMINLKMQIIGDPEFIKQDDLFINPGNILTANQPQDTNSPYVPGTKSLSMDLSDIYTYVTFRTPKDFNDKTGMYDLNSTNKYSVSEMSGFYKVIKVSNEFRGGKFTQTLEMVRQAMQEPINKNKATNTDIKTDGDNQRTELTQKSQQTANPAVQSNNVNPSPSPAATETTSPSTTASSGPDGDGAVTSANPTNGFNSPLNINKPEFAPPAALSGVINNGKTVSIDDAAPTTGGPVIAP